MRNKGNPEGRVYDIKPKRQWSRDTKDEVNEADVDINALPSRTVLVIGRSGQRRGWCRVACVCDFPFLAFPTHLTTWHYPSHFFFCQLQRPVDTYLYIYLSIYPLCPGDISQ